MTTKDNMLTDVSAELEKEFGKHGTPERAKFDDEAYAFYIGQILLQARKEAKITQSELAKRISSTKSYISRIENGAIDPSVLILHD
jgi:ribosome-binding protein aMBF1 (putative translation factor)